MARILIIEDEKAMAEGLRDNFEIEGDTVSIAGDGETGTAQVGRFGPDLVILDLMLPKKSGFDVCREIRAAGHRMPILMLTARGQEIDKVLGLELGADDYMTKPFSVRELLARVKALLRRASLPAIETSRPVTVGELTVDFTRFTARDRNGEVELTHKEYELLKYLMDNRSRPVSRNELLDKVWGYDALPATRTVDNYIARLRKRVESDPDHPRIILTAHGIGYKFVG